MDSEEPQTPAAPDTAVEAASSAAPQPVTPSNGSRETEPAAPAAAPSGPPQPQPPFPDSASINELQGRSLGSLQTYAATLGWRVNGSRTKHQLIAEIAAWLLQHGTQVTVEGFLEMQQESFGLIRYPRYSFTPLPEDIFVPVFVIRKFGLRSGQLLKATLKVPREKEKYLAMDRLVEIEGVHEEQWQAPADFDKLTATFPSQRIILETPKSSSVSSRVVDIIAPLGKGQRALIVASPRSGKTMLLKDVARSIKSNHSEVTLIILLLDERPEEVTDFEESVETEIYSSTFDEAPKRHSQVAELVLERAKRLVELGKDVVILLDSITRLARGYNAMLGGKGRTMSGGLDAKALMKPKKFFGAARNIENGGSLTVIATALVESGSTMDEVIFEEFKGTGNMEVRLRRDFADQRLFPAIDAVQSGTRREELLMSPDELATVWKLRRVLAGLDGRPALELLLGRLRSAQTNLEFLAQVQKTAPSTLAGSAPSSQES